MPPSLHSVFFRNVAPISRRVITTLKTNIHEDSVLTAVQKVAAAKAQRIRISLTKNCVHGHFK